MDKSSLKFLTLFESARHMEKIYVVSFSSTMRSSINIFDTRNNDWVNEVYLNEIGG